MNRKDIELIAEAASKVVEEDRDVVGELEKAGWCKDKDWPDPKKLHSADSKECQDKAEDAEGSGVVYMVLGEADYEAPDIRGIYSDEGAAVEAAKGLQGELPPDFDISVIKIQLNTPLDFDTKRNYVEYDSGEVSDHRADKGEFIGTSQA